MSFAHGAAGNDNWTSPAAEPERFEGGTVTGPGWVAPRVPRLSARVAPPGDDLQALDPNVVDVLRIAVDAIEGEAMLISRDGRVVLANEAGQVMASHHPASMLQQLASFGGKGTAELQVWPLKSNWTSQTFYFVVRRRSTGVMQGLLQRRAKEWALTARQRQTLECLVAGLCNKEISRQLSCALRTVELHVSAVLRCSGSSSRSAVIAKFWATEPSDDESGEHLVG